MTLDTERTYEVEVIGFRVVEHNRRGAPSLWMITAKPPREFNGGGLITWYTDEPLEEGDYVTLSWKFSKVAPMVEDT